MKSVPPWYRLNGARHSPVIYFVEAVGAEAIKIGCTTSLRKRLRALAAGSPTPIQLLAVVAGTLVEEEDLHRRFTEARLHNEWFRASDVRPFAERLATLKWPQAFNEIATTRGPLDLTYDALAPLEGQ